MNCMYVCIGVCQYFNVMKATVYRTFLQVMIYHDIIVKYTRHLLAVHGQLMVLDIGDWLIGWLLIAS